jgi:hypothetical protein
MPQQLADYSMLIKSLRPNDLRWGGGPAAAKSLRTKDLRLLKNSEKIPQRA